MKDQKSACLDTSTQDVSPTLNVEFTDHPLAQNSADKTSEDTVDTLGNQKVDTFATSQDVLDTQKSAEEGTSGTPRTKEAYTNNIHAVTPAETSEVTSDDGAELTDDVEDDTQDSLTFSNGVIEKIVAIAMRDVKDVVGMKGSWFNRVQDVLGASDARKGVTVEVTHDASVRVNISVLIKYGAYAPQVFEDVKEAVVSKVMEMTGLSVAGVNLRIEDVLTPEEYEAQDMTKEHALTLNSDEEKHISA
ncbi:Asp23/Gls24 family envelope stress response protein [Fannyhessea vaginae]|uniref:Asp23/Gls24 family envelope stress response protein n=1 Tax=Fannyhessea vaginae TaxID=82135 RepID=UPI0026F2B55E|nr:Asp23/Gls24 family envelope stress response protein [Fannyhessea vaginae]